VAGADGGAWLFNGLEWWKFDPWQAVFVVPEVAPSDGPDGDMPGPVALDPGLFVWLARDVPGDARSPARVRGFRHGVRGAYTRDAGLMLLSDAEHWVADRPPRSGGDVDFDLMGLHLSNGARAALADTSYRDFTLTAETPSDVLPQLEIGDVVVGDGSCFWPSSHGRSFAVTRRGSSLDLDVGGVHRGCDGPAGHVALVLRAPDVGTPVVVTKVAISRL
jgi:hypothetical protein